VAAHRAALASSQQHQAKARRNECGGQETQLESQISMLGAFGGGKKTFTHYWIP
jgi:hypothetical protein